MVDVYGGLLDRSPYTPPIPQPGVDSVMARYDRYSAIHQPSEGH